MTLGVSWMKPVILGEVHSIARVVEDTLVCLEVLSICDGIAFHKGSLDLEGKVSRVFHGTVTSLATLTLSLRVWGLMIQSPAVLLGLGRIIVRFRVKGLQSWPDVPAQTPCYHEYVELVSPASVSTLHQYNYFPKA